ASLVRKHGEASRARAERGVRQVSAYWRADDGDAGALRAFVEDAFVADPQQLDALLGRFSAAFEQIDGHMLEIGRALRSWNELEPDGRRLFPKGVRLLSHWNLRDQIKVDYAEPDKALALTRQRLIRDVMERIVTQTIPRSVIDDPRVEWNPATNSVTATPPEEVETEQMKKQGKRPAQPSRSAEREPDQRYAVLLADFRAARQL